MIQDEIRPNIEDLVRDRAKVYFGGEVVGEAVGATPDGLIVVRPKRQEPIPATGVQIGGNHYQGLKIQPVEYNYANGLPFIEGNVVKYITRHRNKNKAEDVKKAIHFCVMLLKLEYGYSKEELEKLL